MCYLLSLAVCARSTCVSDVLESKSGLVFLHPFDETRFRIDAKYSLVPRLAKEY